jgi:hypothetical protein
MIPKSCRLFGQDHATKQAIRAKWRIDLIPFRSGRRDMPAPRVGSSTSREPPPSARWIPRRTRPTYGQPTVERRKSCDDRDAAHTPSHHRSCGWRRNTAAASMARPRCPSCAPLKTRSIAQHHEFGPDHYAWANRPARHIIGARLRQIGPCPLARHLRRTRIITKATGWDRAMRCARAEGTASLRRRESEGRSRLDQGDWRVALVGAKHL